MWDSRTSQEVMTSQMMVYKRLQIQALLPSMVNKTEEFRLTTHNSISRWWWEKLSKVLIKWVQNDSTWMQVLKKLVTFHLPLSSNHRRKRKRRRKRSPPPLHHNSRCKPAISKTTNKTMAWANSTKMKTTVNVLASSKNKNASWLKSKKNSVFLLSRRKNFCSKNSSSKEECKKSSSGKRKRKQRLKLVYGRD